VLSQSESRARNGWEMPARDDLLLLAVAVVWKGRECWWIRIRAFLCHFQPQNFRVLYTKITTSTSQPGFATHSRLPELLLLQPKPHPPFCSCSSIRTHPAHSTTLPQQQQEHLPFKFVLGTTNACATRARKTRSRPRRKRDDRRGTPAMVLVWRRRGTRRPACGL